MITSDYCKMMSAYNAWMNSRLYELCDGIGDAERKADRGAFFRSIHSTLNHLMYADLAFMSRFTGEPAEVPELGIDLYEEFEPLWDARQKLDERMTSWSSSLTETWLEVPLTYISKVDGKERTFPRWVVVTHMFNHQTHHRGQMTTLITQMGHDIGATDITFMPQF